VLCAFVVVFVIWFYLCCCDCCMQYLTEDNYEAKKALEIAGLEKTIQMQKEVRWNRYSDVGGRK